MRMTTAPFLRLALVPTALTLSIASCGDRHSAGDRSARSVAATGAAKRPLATSAVPSAAVVQCLKAYAARNPDQPADLAFARADADAPHRRLQTTVLHAKDGASAYIFSPRNRRHGTYRIYAIWRGRMTVSLRRLISPAGLRGAYRTTNDLALMFDPPPARDAPYGPRAQLRCLHLYGFE
jgi:hypothetical protein